LSPVLVSLPQPNVGKSANTAANINLPKGINSLFSSLLMPLNMQIGKQKAEPVQIEQTIEGLVKLIKDSISPEQGSQLMTNDNSLDLKLAAKLTGVNLTDLKTILADLVKEISNLQVPKNNKLQALVNSAKNNLTKDDIQEAMQNVLEMIGAVPVQSLLGLDQTKLKTVLSEGSNLVHQAENLNLPLNQALQMIAVKNNLKNLVVKLEAFTKPFQMDNKNIILQTAFSTINPSAKSQTNSQKEAKASLPVDPLKNDKAEETPNPPNLMTKIEQYVIHTNKDGEGPRFEQFVKDFSSILSKSQFVKGANSNTLIIKLNPEHLGTLKVELVDQNGSITAKMIASSSMAKDMLDSQLSQLKTAFSQQNIRVDKIDIYYSSGDSVDKEFSQQQSSNGQENKQDQHQQRLQQNTDEDFLEVLNENLIEKE
jgi:flagellar hook-length control protein FliK